MYTNIQVPLCIGLRRHKSYLCLKGVFFRNDGDAKPAFLYFQIVPKALGPISSCRASETNGKYSWEEMSVGVRKGGFMANLLLH